MKNKYFNFDFDLPIEFGESEMIIEVRVSGYRFGYPAKISGRPEDSYPAEGSDFSGIELYLITQEEYREDGKNRVKQVRTLLPDAMYDVVVVAYGGEDKWYEKIDEEAGEADDRARDEYYDAKYDEMRERGER